MEAKDHRGLRPGARRVKWGDGEEDNCPERSATNAAARLKRQDMGREVVVAVTKGRLDFGPCKQFFEASRDGWHVSLDRRRRKRVLVKIVGE